MSGMKPSPSAPPCKRPNPDNDPEPSHPYWCHLHFELVVSRTLHSRQRPSAALSIVGHGICRWRIGRHHKLDQKTASHPPTQTTSRGVDARHRRPVRLPFFFYFTSLRNAPPVDAGLINYLWPLLIVLFSALLPGERLKPHHVLGALLGLGGAVLIVTKGRGIDIEPQYAFGYAIGICGALTWSSYSVLSRRVAHVPTSAVTGFCAATAILSLLCHIIWEQTIWPSDLGQWLAVLGLGLGPLGSAFYTWDLGMKKKVTSNCLRGRLSGTAPFNADLDWVRLCRIYMGNRRCMRLDHRWRAHRIKGYDPPQKANPATT